MEGGQSSMIMHEWEMGLPSLNDLIPLTQSLISPELAHAFGINSEPSSTHVHLNRVSAQATYSTKCPKDENNFEPLRLFPTTTTNPPKEEPTEHNGPGRALKRPRLVWTPQLHKRFVDVIDHLGIDKAVPKTIMEMMNVDGLTRENVASHLQKYRLYLKRTEGVCAADVQSNPRRVLSFMDCDTIGSSPGPGPIQVAQQHCDPSGPYGFGHLGFPAGTSASSGYCGLESGGSFNMFWNQQRG